MSTALGSGLIRNLLLIKKSKIYSVTGYVTVMGVHTLNDFTYITLQNAKQNSQFVNQN